VINENFILYLVEEYIDMVIKRDNSKVAFDGKKIIDAINKAFIEVDG